MANIIFLNNLEAKVTATASEPKTSLTDKVVWKATMVRR